MAGEPKGNAGMFVTMLFNALFRRRSRAGMAVVASMVGAATLFVLVTICIAVPQQMSQEMREYGANIVVSAIEDSSGDSTSDQGIDPDMVAHTTDMVRAKGDATYATYRYENVRVNAAPYVLAGIDPNAVSKLNRHWDVSGAWPSHGGVMVGRDVADALGASVGSTLTIGYRASDNATTSDSGTDSSDSGDTQDDTENHAEHDESSTDESEHTPDGRVGTDDMGTDDMGTDNMGTDIMDTSGTALRVTGIVDTGGSEDQIIYALDTDVDALAGGTRGVDVIEYSSSAQGSDLTEVVSSINDMTSMHVKAQEVTKITSSDTTIMTMLTSLFWLVSLVVLTLTLVGVGTTITSIVSQRSSEIGLRKALGASSSSIGLEFTMEAALYGLCGGILGTAFGYVLARVLCQTVFARSVQFSWPLGFLTLLVSMLIAVLGSVVPVRRATRIDPAVVLTGE